MNEYTGKIIDPYTNVSVKSVEKHQKAEMSNAVGTQIKHHMKVLCVGEKKSL